jgi:hypothetical protein
VAGTWKWLIAWIDALLSDHESVNTLIRFSHWPATLGLSNPPRSKIRPSRDHKVDVSNTHSFASLWPSFDISSCVLGAEHCRSVRFFRYFNPSACQTAIERFPLQQLSFESASTFCQSSSNLTTASCPPSAAQDNGVRPKLSFESAMTSYRSSSSLTTASCPPPAAKDNGVWP